MTPAHMLQIRGAISPEARPSLWCIGPHGVISEAQCPLCKCAELHGAKAGTAGAIGVG